MVTKCIIKFCNTIKSGDGVTLHKLPSDAAVQKEWFRAILDETGQTIFSEDDVICSKHFAPSCFTVIDRKPVLNPTAIPFESLKIEGPEPKKIKREKSEAVQCGVFTCGNTLGSTDVHRPELVYHPFPKKQDLAVKWKIFCSKEDNDFEHSYVCSDHFTANDYREQKRNRGKTLKADAIPTIYKREALVDDQSESDQVSVGSGITAEPVYAPKAAPTASDMQWGSPSDNQLCAILNCPSSNEAATAELYPIPEQMNVRKKWLKSIEAHTTQTDLPNNATLCSLHFAQNCFKAGKDKKILLAHAVPSIFPTPNIANGDFPVLQPADLSDPQRGREFYEWSMKNYQEQRHTIQSLKDQAAVQSKRIARLAKSVDDFKAKRFVSEDANNALQKLFDKIIDVQYDVI